MGTSEKERKEARKGAGAHVLPCQRQAPAEDAPRQDGGVWTHLTSFEAGIIYCMPMSEGKVVGTYSCLDVLSGSGSDLTMQEEE